MGKKPLAKFLCIKLIVMFTWYQSFVVSMFCITKAKFVKSVSNTSTVHSSALCRIGSFMVQSILVVEISVPYKHPLHRNWVLDVNECRKWIERTYNLYWGMFFTILTTIFKQLLCLLLLARNIRWYVSLYSCGGLILIKNTKGQQALRLRVYGDHYGIGTFGENALALRLLTYFYCIM